MNNEYYDVILTASNAIVTFPRLERTARFLKNFGIRCLAVGWDRERSHPKIERKDGFDILQARFPGQYGGGIANLLGLLCWNIRLLRLHFKFHPKIIHAYDFDTILPAICVRALINCKVVYDIADWYADSRKVGFLRPLVEKAERWACRKVDLVVLAHEKRLQQLGFTPRQWLVIYNTPQDCADSLPMGTPADDEYFVYVGVLHPDRGLEQIVDASSALGVKLILAGFGPLADYCKKVAVARENVEFLGKIPYWQTLEIERNALAIIALYDPRLRNNQLAAPNKLYEAMMLGRPLITTKGTLVGEVVEKEGIGITVPYGDVQALVEALYHIKNSAEERSEMGRRARMLYESEYSYDIQCERLRQAYQKIWPEGFEKSRGKEG